MKFRSYLLLFFLLFGFLFSAEEEEDEYRFRFRTLTKSVEKKGTPPRADDDHGGHGLSQSEMLEKQKDVADFMKEKRKTGEPLTKADVAKLYSLAKDFSVIHSLLGSDITAEESRAIGRLRAEIHEEVLQSLAKSKRFGKSMGVNDFGSGADLSSVDAKTDIDFTLYNKLGAEGKAMVDAYIQEFRRITGNYGAAIDPGQADIVAHKYEATLPDWRQGSDLGLFETKLRTGLDLLRSNPEAYFLEGAYMQQVMKRSVDPNAKTFTWYDVDDNKQITKDQQSAALQKEYFFHPETHKRYAFGGSVGNWHFFHAHGDDQVARAKYILRSIDDGVGMVHPEMKKGDFEKLSPADQSAFVQKVYGGKFSPETVKGIMATLKTSSHMRQLKKDKKLNLMSTEGKVDAYRPLIDLLRPQNPGVSDADLVKIAESQFNKLGNAILIENNIQSSTERFKDWLKPPLKPGEKLKAVDENGNPKTYSVDSEMIKRLQYSAFFELHSALSLMDEGLIRRIKQANPRFQNDIRILEGIIKKKKQMMNAPEGMDPKESLDWRKARAAEVQAEIQRLKGVLQTKGYSSAFFEGTKSTWNAGQQFEDWMQRAMVENLVKVAGGKKYIPLLRKLQAEVKQKNQEMLGPKWMARLDKANSIVEVLKVYAREGEINDNVLKVALYEGLSFVPGMGTLFSIQGGVQGVSTLVFTNVIPGYGQILLVLNLARGTVELGGLMVLEPLKRDKILLAYQGYLEPEEGGWFFTTGQKERVESPRPPLLYPVDPGGVLPLDVRREKMYHYIHDQIVAKMKNNPEIWYEEHEYPEDWQAEEFKLLKPFVREYVNHWHEGTGPFSEFDVLTVHRGPDIREELIQRLLQDYVQGKNIAIQKEILERQKGENDLISQYMDIAAGEHALEKGGQNFRGDYNQMAELVRAHILDDMPTIEPSIEIIASQNFDEIEKEEDEKEIISERVNLRAKVNASFKDHPGPWTIEWKMDNAESGEVDLLWGRREEVEATTGTVTITAIAKDADGKEIVRGSIPLSVEKVKIKEAEDEEDEEKEDQKIGDVSDILKKLGEAVGRAEDLSQETKEKCDSSKKKAEEASKNIEEVENKVKVIANQVTGLQNEMQDLINKIDDASSDIKNLDQISTLIAKIRDIIRKKALEVCEKAQNIVYAKTIDEQKDNLKDLLKLRDDIKDEHKKGIDEIQDARQLMEKIKGLKELVKKFGDKVEKVKSELSKTEPQGQKTKGDVQDSETDLNTAKGKTNELRGVEGNAGELVKEGKKILEPTQDMPDAKKLMDEMEGLMGQVSEIKEGIENCPDEVSNTVSDVANQQNALEDSLNKTQKSIDKLLEDWNQSNSLSSIQQIYTDVDSTMYILNIFWETILDRIKDSEVCEKIGRDAAAKPPKLRVPNVVGDTIDDATNTLKEVELKVKTIGGDPAPEEELSFTVASQVPSAGSSARSGDTVTLEIYAEFKALLEVPNVQGLPVQEAINRIVNAGLSPNSVGGDPAPEEDLSFTIAGQEPAPGTEVEAGASVTIVIYAEFQPKFVVPDVVGMDRAAAKNTLASEGFGAAEKKGDHAPSKDQVEKVYAQSPAGGTEFEEEGVGVTVTYYDKVKEEEPPTGETPPAEEKPPIYIVGRIYSPEPKRKPPKGVDTKAWYQRLTLSDVKFVPSDQFTYLAITGDALNYYSPEFFTQNKRLAFLINIRAPNMGSASGAMLFEVNQVFLDPEQMLQQHPQAQNQQSNLLFDRGDGTFIKNVPIEGGTASISGGPLVPGWSNAMKQKSLDLLKWIVKFIDCFVATSVYESKHAPQLDSLREFRDQVMMKSEVGKRLVEKYYRHGPGWGLDLFHKPQFRKNLVPVFNGLSFVASSVDWNHPIPHFIAIFTMELVDHIWELFDEKEEVR